MVAQIIESSSYHLSGQAKGVYIRMVAPTIESFDSHLSRPAKGVSFTSGISFGTGASCSMFLFDGAEAGLR